MHCINFGRTITGNFGSKAAHGFLCTNKTVGLRKKETLLKAAVSFFPTFLVAPLTERLLFTSGRGDRALAANFGFPPIASK